MNKECVKKDLAVAVIFLFISVSTIPSTGNIIEQSTLSFDGKTLYVGGSGEGNYTRIQDAIDNASDGDTVFVYNGTYVENLIVDKSITMLGENKDTTVIDGSGNGNVVNIPADWVNISGLTIQNGSYGIDIRSNSNNITGNTISSNRRYGIWLSGSSSNTISGNNISSNDKSGIIVDGYNSIIMGNNIIFNNDGGIVLLNSSNIVTGNNISSNREAGIYIAVSSNNNITGNKISSNNGDGMFYGGSSSNTVTGNTISSNRRYGIWLLVSNSNTIIKNNFLGNKRDAYFENCFKNTWNENYWNRPRILPKLIFGRIGRYFLIPWINFDWHPAKEPYDIGV